YPERSCAFVLGQLVAAWVCIRRHNAPTCIFFGVIDVSLRRVSAGWFGVCSCMLVLFRGGSTGADSSCPIVSAIEHFRRTARVVSYAPRDTQTPSSGSGSSARHDRTSVAVSGVMRDGARGVEVLFAA
ncbi:unnamed protein product, partial [Ectocarpus fasciculatus]